MSGRPELDLSLCEQEQIHIPNAIQPHGALLAADFEAGCITHASGNLAQFLGCTPAEVLGGPLEAAIGEAAGIFLEALAAGKTAQTTSAFLDKRAAGTGENPAPLHLQAHVSGRYLSIDIENVPLQWRAGSCLDINKAQPVIGSFTAAASRLELCDLAVRGLKALTGYDRVMAYRFYEDGHGEVISECREPHLEPFLGLHYPASDIPPQARQIYLRKRVNTIADTSYMPVALLVQPGRHTEAPLDLTHSFLRSVSPYHLEYMRNMGVAASLVIGLTHQEKLWGMLVCHHYSTRIVGPDIRSMAEMIGQAASLLIGSLGEAEIYSQRLKRNATLHALTDYLATPVPLLESLAMAKKELLRLVDAQGAVARIAGELRFFGTTPPPAAAEHALETLLKSTAGDGLLAVDNLTVRYPGLSGCKSEGSGALLMRILPRDGDAILWFRPEVSRKVFWGGNPDKAVNFDLQTGRLHPRSSFVVWKEAVSGCAAPPWSETDLALVQDFRSAIKVELASRAREELAWKSQLLEITLENTNQGVLMVDAEGRLQVCNSEAMTKLGLTKEQLETRPYYKEVLTSLWHNYFSMGHMLGGPLEEFLWERYVSDKPEIKEFNSPSGIVYEVCSTPLPRGGVVRTLTDITRRKEFEAIQLAMEKANRRITVAVNSGRIGIWDWDVISNQLIWDSSMYRLYGLEAGDGTVAYDLWKQCIHEDDIFETEAALQEAMHGLKPFEIEFRVIWKDGSEHYIHSTGEVTLDSNGWPQRMTGANWDVTDAREHAAAAERQALLFSIARDEALRTAKVKSEFLATMSHEIRSPLSGLVGVIELLRDSNLDDDQRHMAEMIHGSALDLLAVLNDILDFSKIEAGALSINLERAAVFELVNELAERYQLQAAAKGVDLMLRAGPDIPAWFNTDPLRLRQILNNLLSNAIKFTAKGKIVISLDVITGEAAAKLRIAVRDTGIGMKASVKARLFEPFVQADGSTTRDFGGTGLGLCISRRLAGLLGGTLDVTSRAGMGSIFSLVLPLAPEAEIQPSELKETPREPLNLSGGGRVLVVDDNETMRWLSKRQLEQIGLDADLAENGEMALQMLRTGEYSLLITDCHMPRMDGATLTKAVRAEPDSVLRSIPVIGVTADITSSQRDLCKAAGMNDLAIKPLNRAQLSSYLAPYLMGTISDRETSPSVSPAEPDGPAIFDTGIYRDLFPEGDPEGRPWLADFLRVSEDFVKALQQFLSVTRDECLEREALAEEAHSLSGTSLSVGATRLGEIARALESAAPHGDLAALKSHFATVRGAFDEAQPVISAFIASL